MGAVRLEAPADPAVVQHGVLGRAQPGRREADLQRRGQAQREELRPPDQVAVQLAFVAVLDQLDPHERPHERFVLGQQGWRDESGVGRVDVVAVAHPGRVPLHPAVAQPGRPPAEHLGAILPVAVLAREDPGVVDRVDPVVLRQAGASGPAGVERIERAHDGGGVLGAVAVARVAVREVGPRAQRAFAEEAQLVAAAVDPFAVAQARGDARAEEVVFLQVDPARVDTPERPKLTPGSSDQVSWVTTSMSTSPSWTATGVISTSRR